MSTKEERLKKWADRMAAMAEEDLPNSGDWRDYEDEIGDNKQISWMIDGKKHVFEIVGPVICDLKPAMAEVVKSATFEDHLEELWKHKDKWYRHAGGGRGFYWTQELELVEVKY